MDKIIGLGNALVDVLAILKDDSALSEMGLPKGSMQLIDEIRLGQINKKIVKINTQLATGGSAGNTILALSNLGVKAGFIGKIGEDDYGRFFKKHFEKCGIEARLLRSRLPSGVASAFISADGERTFGTYLGAASSLKAEDLSPEMFKGYAYLYVEGYLVQDHDMILHAMQLAKDAGLQICIDLASYNIVKEDPGFFTTLVNRYADIVFANEEEAKAFTGKEEPKEALRRISGMCSIAVVKMGAKGSYVKKGTEEVCVKALPVRKVADTTGAGDYFAAGFLYGLICGYSLGKCAAIGTILSAKVIQRIGTNLTKKQWNEIKLNIDAVLSE